MSKRPSLKPLIERKESQLDVAARHLAQRRRQVQQAQEQLELLTSYRNEYLREIGNTSAHGVSSALWGNQQAFLGKLDQAIEEQLKILSLHQSNEAHSLRECQSHRKTLKSYQTLEERHEQAERKQQERVEQRQTDAAALTAWLRGKSKA